MAVSATSTSARTGVTKATICSRSHTLHPPRCSRSFRSPPSHTRGSARIRATERRAVHFLQRAASNACNPPSSGSERRRAPRAVPVQPAAAPARRRRSRAPRRRTAARAAGARRGRETGAGATLFTSRHPPRARPPPGERESVSYSAPRATRASYAADMLAHAARPAQHVHDLMRSPAPLVLTQFTLGTRGRRARLLLHVGNLIRFRGFSSSARFEFRFAPPLMRRRP